MILRIHRRENPFVQIDKRPLEDSRLSWRAKGILAYLLSKPNDWTVRTEDILAHGTEGRDAVRSAMGELKETGYAKLQNTAGGREWIIMEEPSTAFQGMEPSPEKANVGKSATSNNDFQLERINRKKGAKAFQIPEVNECRQYAAELGMSPEEGNAFHDHHSTRGWIPSGQRKQMSDWKAAMRTWFKNWKKYTADKLPPVAGNDGEKLTGRKLGRKFGVGG